LDLLLGTLAAAAEETVLVFTENFRCENDGGKEDEAAPSMFPPNCMFPILLLFLLCFDGFELQ
jgi:hypothetical protein